MENLTLKNKKVLGFGEVMLRLTPPNYQRILQSNSFEAVYSGGEANVIASLSILGHDTKFVTKVPNNYLGDNVINKFKGYNIDLSEIIQGEGRLGIYFAEIGHGLRSTEVIYDRKYSAISMAERDEFNFDKILKDVGIIHLSGITPALSQNLKQITVELIKEAKKRDIIVSFDSNYRAKLWSIEEAREVLEEILPYIDYGFFGYLDMIKILNFEDREDLDFDERLEYLYKELFRRYPNLKYVASTKRTVNAINNNTLQGYLFNGKTLVKSNDYTFDIVDRVGGGDAYTAGILHGILKDMPEDKIVEFGVCASALKHSIVGDINIIDERAISDLIQSGLCNIRR